MVNSDKTIFKKFLRFVLIVFNFVIMRNVIIIFFTLIPNKFYTSNNQN